MMLALSLKSRKYVQDEIFSCRLQVVKNAFEDGSRCCKVTYRMDHEATTELRSKGRRDGLPLYVHFKSDMSTKLIFILFSPYMAM